MRSNLPRLTRMLMLLMSLSSLLAFGGAAPASAHGHPSWSPTKIDLFDPPATVPARTPLYLSHGYCTDLKEEIPLLMRSSTRVDVEVDGRRLPIVGLDIKTNPNGIPGHEPCIKLKHDVFVLPFGLRPGTHTIRGCWYWEGELDVCLEATISAA